MLIRKSLNSIDGPQRNVGKKKMNPKYSARDGY
jgi:hypothetical protein